MTESQQELANVQPHVAAPPRCGARACCLVGMMTHESDVMAVAVSLAASPVGAPGVFFVAA